MSASSSRRYLSSLAALALANVALAQAQRSYAEVTADGVFVRSQTSAVSLPLGGSPSPQGLRWTWSQASTASIMQSTSLGQRGTLAWLGANLNNQRLGLVASTENASPPAPVYQVPYPGVSGLSVAAADKSPACAVATVFSAGGGSLDYYRSRSATAAWQVSYASGFEIAISDDGRYVAAGFSPTQTTSQVDVYDALSPTPNVPIRTLSATTHGFRHLDISGDGSTVLLATNTDNHVFDVASGNQIFTDSSTVSHDAHAISRDGSAWGRGGFNPIRAWVRSGTTYNLVLNHNDTSMGFAVMTAADISGDGSTFVVAGYDANVNTNMRIHCFALTATGSSLLWTYSSNGGGSSQDVPQTVSISDDGKYIAVATWGTDTNDHPETLFFDRDAGGVPTTGIDSPGSAFSCDLSGDGQFLVAGTKGTHANTFGNGGAAYSFDRGGQGYWLEGTASIGRTIQLSAGGATGESVFIGFASALGGPLTVPGIGGSFQLDLGSFTGFLSVGTVGGSGVLSTPINVPNVGALVGSNIYTQAVTSSALTFTNTLLLPITP